MSKRQREEQEDELQDEEEFNDDEEEGFEDDEEDEDGPPAKKKRNPFIDDAADEDEEDDEEEGGGRGRRGRTGNRFIDDVAVVDDDEDDEAEDEDDDMGDLIANPEDEIEDSQFEDRNAYRNRDLDRSRDAELSEEEILRRMRERWKSTQDVEVRDEINVVNQQSLLPDYKKDPKLWLVQCKHGHEKELCLQLYQKYFYLLNRGQPLLFTSAFCLDALGFIYVEAEKEAHVLDAIRGLRTVYIGKGVKLVPQNQMVDTLQVNRVQSKMMEADRYVRIRGAGAYKGDIAQIVDVNIASEKVRLKLVPRLDMGQLTGRTEKRPFGRSKIKPPPRPFNYQEMQQLSLPVQPKGRFRGSNDPVFQLNSMTFVQGYLLKSMSMKLVVLLERPPLEELQSFIQAGQHEGEQSTLNNMSKLAASLPAGQINQKSQFVTGDKIIVTSGDLQGLEGKVVGITEDGNININPELEDMRDQVLPIEPSALIKHFKIGDHVKVAYGQNEGNTGLVTGIDNKIVTIICDDNSTSLNVFVNDIKLSDHVDPTNDTANILKLHELVSLSQGTYGIIVDTDKDTCKVLTTNSTQEKPDVRVCKYNELRRWPLKNVQRNVAPDINGKNISRDDIVIFQQGPLKGKSATVIFVVRSYIFLSCREIKIFGGITCCQSRIVNQRGGVSSIYERQAPQYQSTYGSVPLSPGAGSRTPSYAPKSPYSRSNIGYTGGDFGGLRSPLRDPGGGGGGNRQPQERVGTYQQFNRGTQAGQYSGRQPQVRQDFNLVGKPVRIKAGSYRGYKGTVLHATDQHVRVQVSANSRVYTIQRSYVVVDEAQTQPQGIRGDRINTPQTGPPRDTPLDGYPPQTPMRIANRTPSYRDTPAYNYEDGGTTPMPDNLPPRTPMLNPNSMPKTPSYPYPVQNQPSSPSHTHTTHTTNTNTVNPTTPRDPFSDDWEADDELQETDIQPQANIAIGQGQSPKQQDVVPTPQLENQTKTPDINMYQDQNELQANGVQQNSNKYPSTPNPDAMNTPMISPGVIPTTPGFNVDQQRIPNDDVVDIVNDYSIYQNLEVQLPDSSHAYVHQVDQRGNCVVVQGYKNGDKWEFTQNGNQMQFHVEQLQILHPTVINLPVKFLKDNKTSVCKGVIGKLIQFDNDDGIVVVGGQQGVDVKIAPTIDLANYVEFD